jgi:FkbM family methyltransferase
VRIQVGKNELPVEIFNSFQIDRITIPMEGLSRGVICRMRETDPEVFHQVFISNEYESPVLPDRANIILDAGANVGYSVLFFKRRYPDATIIALEPDPTNFAVLQENCAHLPDIVLLRLALWNSCTRLQLQFTGAKGDLLGSWGVRTVERDVYAAGVIETEAVDVPELMRRFALDEIDICKIDIEGAEKEVFADPVAPWYEKVGLFIIETHARFARGSDGAVKTALREPRWERSRHGENQLFRRIAASLADETPARG